MHTGKAVETNSRLIKEKGGLTKGIVAMVGKLTDNGTHITITKMYPTPRPMQRFGLKTRL